MAQLISDIWSGLRDAGLPEVMLYLADNSASRCHWDDTAEIGDVRVALLADQDRQIVRIVPIDMCVGIGVASPKGVDPSGYKLFVQNKLRPGGPLAEPEREPEPEPVKVAPLALPPTPPPPPVAQTPEPRSDSLASRFGVAMRPATNGARPAAAQGAR